MAKQVKIASKSARTARKIEMTPGQKAAATKRAMGLDLTAVAQKAHATRLANIAAAEKAAKAEARKAKRAAR